MARARAAEKGLLTFGVEARLLAETTFLPVGVVMAAI